MIKSAPSTDRILSLDLLRGYFVLVIIIDHLSRFPSIWQFFTGEGIMWVTAAEGFVMISGLMIGFVRGYKGLSKPFKHIAAILFKRSLLLYIWMVLGSLLYIAITWKIGNIRSMPWYDSPVGNWPEAIERVVTMQLPHAWVHFLYLYAIFLMLSIPAIWLLRKKQAWIVACLSLVGYIYGFTHGVEWLRFQIVFFIPAIAGFYLVPLRTWWAGLPHTTVYKTLIYSASAITLMLSVLYTFYASFMPNSMAIDHTMSIGLFGPLRVLLAGLWFIALVFIFEMVTPWLRTHTYGIFEYFGTHSLTAYIAHGLILCAVALLIPIKNNFIIDTFAGFLAIYGVYLFIRLPGVRHLIPR